MNKFSFIYPLGHSNLDEKRRKLIRGFEEDLNFIYTRKPLRQFKPEYKKVLEDTGCVIVTYNNLSYLRDLLHDLCYSTALPKDIVIINNASTDKTLSFLKSFFSIRGRSKTTKLLSFTGKLLTKKVKDVNVHIITLEENTGGSGGFAFGLFYVKNILKDKWCFTMDDDIRVVPTLLNNIFNSRGKDIALTGVMLSLTSPNRVIEAGAFLGNGVYSNFGLSVYWPYKKKRYYASDESWYKTDYSVLALSFIPVAKLDIGNLLKMKDFFIHWDDSFLFLSNNLNVISKLEFRYWHKFGESTSFFGWIKFYDVRNAFYLIKTLIPEKFIKARNRFLSDLKVFLWQSKYQLIQLFIQAFEDGVKGRLGKISYTNKFSWLSIDNYNEDLSKNNKVAFIDYTGSLFKINRIIKTLKRNNSKQKIYVYTRKTLDTTIYSIKKVLGVEKVYYWNKMSLINRLRHFLKYNLFITSFNDVPRIFLFMKFKIILMFQKKDDKILFYKVKTSLIKTLKTYLQLVRLRYF